MIRSRLLSGTPALAMLGILLALAACNSNAASPQTSSPTSTTPAPHTPMPTDSSTSSPCSPPIGGPGYSTSYYSMLPETDHSGVKAYDIPLPPQTRYLNDSASGHRRDYLCSAGAPDSVEVFMTQHLTQLGWQQIAQSAADHCEVVSNYGHPQCWQNGTYELFVGINRNFDWVIAFLDPAFLP